MKTKDIRNFLSALLVYFISLPTFADVVQVLVGVAPEAANEVSATDLALHLNTQIPIIMARSGMADKVFVFTPYLATMNYEDELAPSSFGAVDWIRGGNDTPFDAARDLGIPFLIDGFDILVMVVLSLDEEQPVPPDLGTCGEAYAPLVTLVNASGNIQYHQNDRERYAHLALSYSAGCRDNIHDSFAHEFGHILGGEHQPGGPGGDPVTEDFYPHDPVVYNHPEAKAYLNLTPPFYAETIMYSPHSSLVTAQFSRNGGFLYNNLTISAGDSDADMYKLFSERWTHVADYRPKPTAAPSNTFFMPCFCQYKSGRQEFSWTSSDPSIPEQSYLVQKQSGGGGWTNVYEGGAECVIFDAPAGGLIYRVRTIVEGMFDSPWVQQLLQCNCTGGGGGGGPL